MKLFAAKAALAIAVGLAAVAAVGGKPGKRHTGNGRPTGSEGG